VRLSRPYVANDAAQSCFGPGKAWLLGRLDRGVHPLDGMELEAARATIAKLRGLEPEPVGMAG